MFSEGVKVGVIFISCLKIIDSFYLDSSIARLYTALIIMYVGEWWTMNYICKLI